MEFNCCIGNWIFYQYAIAYWASFTKSPSKRKKKKKTNKICEEGGIVTMLNVCSTRNSNWMLFIGTKTHSIMNVFDILRWHLFLSVMAWMFLMFLDGANCQLFVTIWYIFNLSLNKMKDFSTFQTVHHEKLQNIFFHFCIFMRDGQCTSAA